MEANGGIGKKQTNIRLIIILAVFIIVGFGCFVFIIIDQAEKLEAKNNLLLQEEADKSTCVYKRDSLLKEVMRLSTYKSLTKAMIHRDEATSLLKYGVGDRVCIKRDSSQGVISDVIIGGSKHQYYVKYKVLHKDNTIEEVIPELIY